MTALPELLEEDVQEINATLKDFLAKSDASLALLIAEGGFIVLQQGDLAQFDTVTLGALSANAFNAAQAISNLVDEPNFTHIYQQGERCSLLACAIDGYNSMVVLFPARVSVGAVKYFAAPATQIIARQLEKARQRPSSRGIDLALINRADSAELFTRKSA